VQPAGCNKGDLSNQQEGRENNAALGAILSGSRDPSDCFACDCRRCLAVAYGPSKVVLDLFERRMQVYSEIRAVIASTVTSGKLPNERHFEFMRAADGAKFLFGRKVNNYLSELNTTPACFHEADEEYSSLQGQARADAIQRRRKHFDEIQAFYKKFDPLVEPYVAMRQRRAWL
jgi:hypothetical protein